MVSWTMSPCRTSDKWEAGLLKHMRGQKKDVLDWLTTEDPKIKGDAEAKLKSAIDDYAKTYA